MHTNPDLQEHLHPRAVLESSKQMPPMRLSQPCAVRLLHTLSVGATVAFAVGAAVAVGRAVSRPVVGVRVGVAVAGHSFKQSDAGIVVEFQLVFVLWHARPHGGSNFVVSGAPIRKLT